jgi:hypothetical protein
MSATLEPLTREPVRRKRGPRHEPAAATSGRVLGDGVVVLALMLLFTAVVAVTWRRWGQPEIDAGAELTTADLIKHGAVAYGNVRYFYGPVGLYSLALAFKIFGTSFATVYGFGLAQAAAILATFYALARHWLKPVVAGLSTAVLLTIGFSGTAFNFVVPHTNSATFGILTVLLMLLALTRGRMLLAGVALGLVGLTRPEFLAVAAAAGVAYVVAAWRFEDRKQALDAGWRLALPGIVVPVAVLGWFAAKVGVSTLVTVNLWPVKFLHQTGFKMQQGWMPLDVPSFFGLLARGASYAGLMGALVVSVEGWRRRSGIARLVALWPLVAVAALLGFADLALRAVGLFAGQRTATLGESWLPALGFVVAAWAAVRFVRRGESPLGRRWAVDAALIIVAAGLGMRAYNAFTAEGSYAPYYAAPLVLVLGIMHARLARERPQARIAIVGALAVVAAGLGAYATIGLYRHFDTPVHTARGTFMSTAAGAAALQPVVRQIDAKTSPGAYILAAPLDGGLFFMSDRRPAIYVLSVLPGLLYSRADELAAIRSLRTHHVALAVIGARDFSLWGSPTFGVDYNRVLGAYLRASTVSRTTVGTLADPAAGTNPSTGFTVLRLRR